MQQTDTAELKSKTGKLYLVDLAGSENVGNSEAVGQQLSEAKYINKSLSALADKKVQHIPYRNAKLTRILQDSLGGNAMTALIITCSPAVLNQQETLSTLRFGMQAKCVINRPKMNKEYTMAELKKLLAKAYEEIKSKSDYIAKLEQLLQELGVTPSMNGEVPHNNLREEIEDLQFKLTEEQASAEAVREELEQALADLKEISDQNSLLQDQLEMVTGQYLSLSEETQSLRNINEQSAQRREELEAEIALLEEANAKLGEMANNHIAARTSHEAVTNQTISDLRVELQNLSLKNAALQEELESAKRALEQSYSSQDYEAVKDFYFAEGARGEREKWEKEKVEILKDMHNRVEKIVGLELALDHMKEEYDDLYESLPLGEKGLRKKIQSIQQNLKETSNNYHKILTEKTTQKFAMQLLKQKAVRLGGRVVELEHQLKQTQDELKIERKKSAISQKYDMFTGIQGSSKMKKTMRGGKGNIGASQFATLGVMLK